MEEKRAHSVVLVDDHTLFRKGIAELVNNFDNYNVIWEASNGSEFFDNLKQNAQPEIVILDIAMPILDGYKTAQIIKTKYQNIKILILSMFDKDEAIIKMLKIGVHGYILKDAAPEEFKLALDEIIEKGNYYSDLVSGTMAKTFGIKNNTSISIDITDQELEYLKLLCTELTNKEIADKMNISVRTVDGYRENLFTKLKVKNRIGLVLFAIKKGYINY